jgi:hypothetical protein
MALDGYLTVWNPTMTTPKPGSRTDPLGRAFAGSQLQMQLYVNRHRADLDAAIKRTFDIAADLEWVSPISEKGYKEYRDTKFLSVLGLSHLERPLRDYWPASGPRWDGLAKVKSRAGGVVLVEGKNYPREVRGRGCKASQVNNARTRIETALQKAGGDLGIADTDDWLGPLYQYANRLAHAAFLRRHGVEAFLVNVCFFDDPHRRRKTSENDWRTVADQLKVEIGFSGSTPSWLGDVFLPARDKGDFFALAY